MRDYQREKVYAAEQAVRRLYTASHECPTIEIMGSTIVIPLERRFGTLEAIREYVARVQAMDWYPQAYPTAGAIKVRNRKGLAWATYHRSDQTIAIPARENARQTWAMTESVVLHEMAHHVSLDHHGPDFTAAFLRHVREVQGVEAEFILRDAFTVGGVDVNYQQLTRGNA